MISLIVAMDKNRVIGVDNQLPWHLPADLKRFKALTMGHHIIMGRKTYESIGKPLPGRKTVIVTRQHDYKAEGCFVVHSLDAAVMMTRGDEHAFIIGGADLFQQSLPYADRVYLTEIELKVPRGDTYFPELPASQWQLVEREDHKPDEKNQYAYSYLTYAKKT